MLRRRRFRFGIATHRQRRQSGGFLGPRRRFQFGIATLLALQVLLSIVLSVWRTFGMPVLIWVVVFWGMLSAIIAATVWVARNQRHPLFTKFDQVERIIDIVIVVFAVLLLPIVIVVSILSQCFP